MPQDSPEACTQRYAECVARGDLEGVGRIFEASARVLSDEGLLVTGREAICALHAEFVRRHPHIEVKLHRVISLGDDLSIVRSSWMFRDLLPSGEITPNSGVSLNVLRRQPDARWCIAFCEVHHAGASREGPPEGAPLD